MHTQVCAFTSVGVGTRGQPKVLFVNDAVQNRVWQCAGKEERVDPWDSMA